MQQQYICPSCGSPSSPQQEFCGRCGNRLVQSQIQQLPTSQQLYSCPTCNNQVRYGERFCAGCGTPFSWQSQQQIQAPLSYYQSNNYQQYQSGTNEIVATVIDYVVGRVTEGGKKQQIKNELLSKGIPDDLGSTIVNKVFGYKSSRVRRAGGIQLGIGLLMTIAGVALTLIGYAAGTTVFIVWWGLIVFGLGNFFMGLFRLLKG
jgi:DNA-directed RNA polymerase subunit RPC12/RpoP